MMNCTCSILANRLHALLFFTAVSAGALAVAFISQYAYGLQPCDLCIYQRIPFVAVVGLGIVGFLLYQRRGSVPSWTLPVMALAFLANAVIAFYHSGVERKWWPSFLEGCAVPKMEGNITDVLARIAETPVVRCDEIPWTDPIIGLSMANYNVLICLCLTALSICALRCHRTNL